MNNNKQQKPILNMANVGGSASPNFLKVAFDELRIYRTPKKIIDYIEAENIKSIIGNPPYNIKGYYR